MLLYYQLNLAKINFNKILIKVVLMNYNKQIKNQDTILLYYQLNLAKIKILKNNMMKINQYLNQAKINLNKILIQNN